MNGRNSKNEKLPTFISLFVGILLWQGISQFGLVDEMFISSPIKVLIVGLKIFQSGIIFNHLLISVVSLALGLILAIISGIFIGSVIGYKDRIYDYLRPYIFILNALPMVAVIPLIVIWFGVGIASKIIVIYLMALVPVLLNTIEGANNVNRGQQEMAILFGANSFCILTKVNFFSSLPFIFAGMRIAAGRAIIGLVIAESFGYGKGIGFLMSNYGATFQTAQLIFCLILLIILSFLLNKIIAETEKIVIKWK